MKCTSALISVPVLTDASTTSGKIADRWLTATAQALSDQAHIAGQGHGTDGGDFCWRGASGGSVAVASSLDGSDDIQVTLNADSFAEADEKFAIRVYESNMDAAYNYPPVIQATFTILDDDRAATANNDVLWRGAGNDRIHGLAGNDSISTGAGNDILWGDAGADTLRGDAGNDTLYGGAGDDLIDGGAGIDTAIFSGATRHYVHLGFTISQNTGEGRDALIGIENLTGGAGTDIFFGNTASNVLRGQDGNDQLYGGGGNDTVYGGDGDDYLHGGADADWAVFSGSQAVTVEMRSNIVTGQGNDTIAGIENIETGAGNDRIVGNAHRNELKGGVGSDTIEGGGGPDVLTGGAGADHFVFADFEGNDLIHDFEIGIDRIDISSNRADAFDDLTISNWKGDAVISWDGKTTIQLEGVNASSLHTSDFIFA